MNLNFEPARFWADSIAYHTFCYSCDILTITQKHNTFTAVKQIGGKWSPKGTKTTKGELNKDGFKTVYSYIGDEFGIFEWAECEYEISENGNKVVLDCGERAIATLTRK